MLQKLQISDNFRPFIYFIGLIVILGSAIYQYTAGPVLVLIFSFISLGFLFHYSRALLEIGAKRASYEDAENLPVIFDQLSLMPIIGIYCFVNSIVMTILPDNIYYSLLGILCVYALFKILFAKLYRMQEKFMDIS